MGDIQAPTLGERAPLGLTNNQLKIIAMVAMFIDHFGFQFFPGCMALRYIGRLAFPIFAFMIAEGCRYTRHRAKYLASVAGMGALCQLVYFVAMSSLYMNVLLTLSMSILFIYSIDVLLKHKTVLSACPLVLCVLVTLVACVVLPEVLRGTDYSVDYGIFGIMLPVVVYYAPNKWLRLVACAICLVGLVFTRGTWQLFALFSLPLLALYNERRGKAHMKYVFYLFYPVHLVLLWLADMLI